MEGLDRDGFLEQHLRLSARLLELEGLDVAAAERRAKEMGLAPGVISIPDADVFGWTLEKACELGCRRDGCNVLAALHDCVVVRAEAGQEPVESSH
ncbi:MAG: hypothetical protein ACLGIZ_15070 [Acidimicrobiia bacterium]